MKIVWQDHHGGGLLAWTNDDVVKGEKFIVLNLLGIEWSAQFCADPVRVDELRLNAKRFYSRYPKSASKLGITQLLEHEIKTAADVAAWVDSICNASVPLSAGMHTGVVKKADDPAGIHHIPWPVASIYGFKFKDFVLFVPTSKGTVAVTPVAPRGSGDGRVLVQYASHGHPLHTRLKRARKPVILPANHPIAKRAFAKQSRHQVAAPLADFKPKR